VVGLSWRDRRASWLESFTIPREERDAKLPQLAASMEVNELVYVATCNRVEIAFVTDGQTPLSAYRRRAFAVLRGTEPRAGEAEQTLRVWHGEGAVEHLFVVAAGLDSARMGEGEIAAQLRESAEQSKRMNLLGSRLGPVVGEALRVAKRIRRVTDGRTSRVSLAEIATRRVLERLDQAPGRVALIGVSPMTERCGRDLKAAGVPLVVVNRTLSRAESLATELGAISRGLDEFRAAPDPVEAVVVATAAPEPVLRRADLERIAAQTASGVSLLIVDLAVPANVAPEDAAAADVHRIGMAEITEQASENRERIRVDFADARAAVDEALTDLRRTAALRFVGPVIAELRRRYRHTAIEGVERLFRRHLPNLTESEREAVRRWAETLGRRFAHIPTVGLRELAFQAGPGAVEAFFASGDPVLARELREAADRAGFEVSPEAESAHR
jgi:glutamyl-tRNA reductase